MNDPFLTKLIETGLWLLLDPVTLQHLAVAGGALALPPHHPAAVHPPARD